SVRLNAAKFANADGRGEAKGVWMSGDPHDSARGGRYPGHLELDGKLANAQAVRIARYLPLGLPDASRHYVEGAVRGGNIKGVSFRVKGHLRDFPFQSGRRAADGELRIAGQVEDATFAFMPDDPQWPPLTKVNGELIID